MLYIGIADLVVGIDNKYEYLNRFCKGYILDGTPSPDITVSVSQEEIDHEISISDIKVSRGYAESICVYRSICENILRHFNGFLLHCALIEYEGRGYAFSAKSGTGKSTHIALWKKVFGDAVTVVNGDKPIVRCINGSFVAYGTPWCGKEGYEKNTSVSLSALCFLNRAENNSIARMSPSDAVSRVFDQLLMPTDIESFDKLSALLDKMLSAVPCYLLGCNMDIDAAIVAYNGMK